MERHQGRYLIYFAALGMEICWLQAWSEFLMVSIFHYQVPILFTVIIYLGGAFSRYVCQLRSWMIIQVLLIRTVCFSAFLVLATYGAFYPFNGYPEELGYHRLFALDKGIAGWGFVFMFVLVSWVIWKRGAVSVANPTNNDNMYHRFDLGIAALAVLLVIYSFLAVHLDVVVADPLRKFQYIPFFLFGLLAIGAVMIANHQVKSYASGFQKIGIALSFSVVILTLGVGVVLLFQSQLVVSAEIISTVARKTGQPLGALFIWLVRALWGPRRMRQDAVANSGSQQEGAILRPEVTAGPGIFEQIIAWVMIGLLIIASVFCLYLFVRALIRFLMRKTGPGSGNQFSINWLAWLGKLSAILQRLFSMIGNRFKLPDCAMDFYLILTQWGNVSGVRGKISETPLEYASRLIRYFPALETEITLLIDMIHLEIYGEKPLDQKQINMARQTCKTLSNPVHWPRRFYRLCCGTSS
ncbi:MAG: DUF4129 domain-containing protein [bacterium]